MKDREQNYPESYDQTALPLKEARRQYTEAQSLAQKTGDRRVHPIRTVFGRMLYSRGANRLARRIAPTEFAKLNLANAKQIFEAAKSADRFGNIYLVSTPKLADVVEPLVADQDKAIDTDATGALNAGFRAPLPAPAEEASKETASDVLPPEDAPKATAYQQVDWEQRNKALFDEYAIWTVDEERQKKMEPAFEFFNEAEKRVGRLRKTVGGNQVIGHTNQSLQELAEEVAKGDPRLLHDVQAIIRHVIRNPLGLGTKNLSGKTVSIGHREYNLRRFSPNNEPTLCLAHPKSHALRVIYIYNAAEGVIFDKIVSHQIMERLYGGR